ncbi:MAG TPA: diguanylate cyclase [Thermoanaerobacterales bacterium]|nr:diguanylate cyclase [Thermoanaerobacterales bacterium]
MRIVFSKLVGNTSNFPLQYRFFHVIALIGFFMSFSASIINYLLDLGIFTVIIPFVCGIISIYLYYLSMYKKKYTLSVYLALIMLTFIFFPTMWLINGGSFGSIPYYLIVYSAFIAVLLKGFKRVLAIILFLGTIMALFIFEYKFPWFVHGYDSILSRYLDVFFGFIIAVIFNAVTMAAVINGYNMEHERVILYLSEVEKQRKEIEQKNYLLEKNNEELKEAKQKTEQLNLKLREISVIDSLTGTYNRRYLLKCLNSLRKTAEKYGQTFSVILLDIDHFKAINDTFGHVAGDKVLKKVCRTIKNNIRETDIFGRLGGEEFMVILPETHKEQAFVVAERIRQDISNITWAGQDMKITVSGGVYQYNNEKLIELLKKVDNFLYQAKNSGRNRIESDIS